MRPASLTSPTSTPRGRTQFDFALPTSHPWCLDCMLVHDRNEGNGLLVRMSFAVEEFAGRGGRAFLSGNWRATWRAPVPKLDAMVGPAMSRPEFKAWSKVR